MQISYETATGVVRQAGESLGDLDGCTITNIPDEEAVHLGEDGTKTWDHETQTITVTPPEPVVVSDPGPDPRVAAIESLIATATSPAQAAALQQFAEAFGIVISAGG